MIMVVVLIMIIVVIIVVTIGHDDCCGVGHDHHVENEDDIGDDCICVSMLSCN